MLFDIHTSIRDMWRCVKRVTLFVPTPRAFNHHHSGHLCSRPMDQAKKDESTSQDPVDEILEAFYHEDLQAAFDSDGDEWLDEGDQDRLE